MAGTDRTTLHPTLPLLARLEVVLVRPQLPENIGAAARAMRNCGLASLCLVSPRDGWPSRVGVPCGAPSTPSLSNPALSALASEQTASELDPSRRPPRLTPDQVYQRAWAVASGAGDLLDAARLVATPAEAVAGAHRVLATTARPRELGTPVCTAEQAAQVVLQALASGQRVSLLFGPERTGLQTEDLGLADTLVTVPLNPGFASLNLGQAVLLVCHAIWRAAKTGEQTNHGGDAALRRLSEDAAGAPDAPATKAAVAALLAHLEQELDAAQFAKSPSKRESLHRVLRNLLVRSRPTRREVSLLHGVITALSGRRLGGALRGAPRSGTSPEE